jgi:PEGA domain.
MNKKNRDNAIMFYFVTFGLGIFLCITTFFIVFNSFSKGIKNSASPQVSIENISSNKFNAVIKNIDARELEIFNINSETNSKINIDEKVQILDKNDSRLDFGKLKVGSIVEVNSQNGKIVSVGINKDSWKMKNISNFRIDNSSKTIFFGSSIYNYSNETIAKYKDEEYDIKKLNSLGVISVSGLNKNIWFIDVIKSYATLSFTGLDKIKGGILKLDNESILTNDLKTKKVMEGAHSISISGDNIETYSKDILVNANETLNIDLSGVQFKCGILNLKINQTGTTIYIDNKKVSLSEPIMLNYGQYNLKITKDGYETYEQEFLMDTDTKEIDVNMVKKIDMGKIRITTIPDNSQIYIDDAYIGLSPVETSIEYGKHNVYAKKDGYNYSSLSVEINSPSVNYEISLEEQ